MAGKTQFEVRYTANLTKEQARAVDALKILLEKSRQDTLVEALKTLCEANGIAWPEAIKKPIGNRTPRKAKFTKP